MYVTYAELFQLLNLLVNLVVLFVAIAALYIQSKKK